MESIFSEIANSAMSCQYSSLLFHSLIKDSPILVKKLRSSSRRRQSRCKHMCNESRLRCAISWDILASGHVIELNRMNMEY